MAESKVSTWRVPFAVARVTFSQIVRDKVLYNSLICAILLLASAFLAGRLTFTRPDRIVTDFGLSVTTIASNLIAIFIGAPMIHKEIDHRTIFMALSKPISRFQFLLGKYLGLLGVLTSNWVLMILTYFLILTFVHGKIHGTLCWALVFIWVQTALTAAIAVLISCISTASIAAMLTVGFYLIGNNISQMRYIAARLDSELPKVALNIFATLLPNMEYFSLGTKVTYGLPLTSQLIVTSLSYGVVMVVTLLMAAGFLFQKKDI